jgi:hypothetical protein
MKDISTELVSHLVMGMPPTYAPLKQQHGSVLAYADVGYLMAAMVGIEEANKDSDQLFVGFANHDKPKQQVNNKAGGRHHGGRGSGYKGNKNVPRPRSEPSGHCLLCGAKGHWAKECFRKAKPTSEYIPPNTDTYTKGAYNAVLEHPKMPLYAPTSVEYSSQESFSATTNDEHVFDTACNCYLTHRLDVLHDYQKSPPGSSV